MLQALEIDSQVGLSKIPGHCRPGISLIWLLVLVVRGWIVGKPQVAGSSPAGGASHRFSGGRSSVGRAPDCGSGGRGFDPRRSPHLSMNHNHNRVALRQLERQRVSVPDFRSEAIDAFPGGGGTP